MRRDEYISGGYHIWHTEQQLIIISRERKNKMKQVEKEI